MADTNGTTAAALAKATPRADLSEKKTKRCSSCRKTKPLSDFGKKRNGSSDGYQYKCGACTRRDMTEYRRRNRKRIREYLNRWHRENRAKSWEIQQRHRSKHQEAHRLREKRYTQKRRDAVTRWRARQAGVKLIHHVDRVAIFKRDRDICWLCEKPVAKKDRSLDHVKPLSLKGPHTARNVRLAHTVCNKRRGNKVVNVAREAAHG